MNELFIRGFFSDSANINSNGLSFYGILFTLGIVISILGLILLFKDTQYG
ncbi:MAG: hypothetical protein ACFFD1_15360 [Candidatus Thorarchaeota archaeon]